MSWVLISLRRKELKRTHADYVAQDLDISRSLRQEARRKMYEQTCIQNDQQAQLRDIKSSYKDQQEYYNSCMDALKDAANTKKEEGEVNQVDFSSFVDSNNKTLSDYQKALEDAKEEYLEEQNEIKSYWEDELQMLEEESNDRETMLEQDKVEAETQMEHISQEISALDQAQSTEIQNSTIKLS